MNHFHQGHNHGDQNIKNIKSALIINLIFTIIELVGGIVSNSVAIISDAVHDLGDTIALSFSLFSEKFAKKKDVSKNYTYGLNRLPLLSAFINSVILLLGSAVILYNAIPRLFNPEPPHVGIMLIVAVVGVVANGWAMMKLKKNEGLNSKVLSLHILEDVLGWFSILIGAVLMYFLGLPIIDPVLSILITLYILFNVFKNIRSAYQLFMQKSPESIETDEILNFIMNFEEVNAVEDFHIWSLEGTNHVMTAHILVQDELDTASKKLLKNKIREGVREFGNIHSTLEIENKTDVCDDHCD
jgi:cobalt-zinc-cadmium efflux system protein